MESEEGKRNNLKAAKTTFQKLKTEWAKRPPNLDLCGQLLADLKILLLELQFLPTQFDGADEELLIARSCLEIGAQWSILRKDIASFERYIKQLKPYYLDYKGKLPESSQMYPLLGLNLLFLLSQNRVAEFHIELELLPIDKLLNNVYIKHPVSLEQYIMEGSYNKVHAAAHIVPDPTYSIFMESLIETIRNELARCLEKAYPKISVKGAMLVLNLPNETVLAQYSKTRNWTYSNGYYIFGSDINEMSVDEEMPYVNVAKKMLQYAREMEMII
ncbi:hypothetical protein PGB90_002332 [Kerria lacca]